MKKRHILLAGLAAIIALAAVDRAVAFRSSAMPLGGAVDLSGITGIRVTGQASRISLTTRADAPLTAQLSERREGWGSIWRSAWTGETCAAGVGMRREGGDLVVEMGDHSRLFDWSDCTLELTANLAPEAAVAIHQQAAEVALAGDFSTADIQANAGDVTVNGHVSHLSLSGAALRAAASFATIRHDETIALAGKMMDVTLRFLTPTPISYAVATTASFIDSRLPNTPGAKPAITIKGEMVRARIE
ncbi:hypothetical protein [Rhizobium paknamense]|uniref:DUF2807 domain-containing protein n=1 Tax=Rhizobium paknamense TaxID=1206817 RepID=A0ABU0I9H9_9HYPH|nr:hypothetical protein [Rhizobium paknamense]MDQ0454342.1 hypothetical protein [Rhizobium paknamense]